MLKFKAPWAFKETEEATWREHATCNPHVKVQAFDPSALAEGIEKEPEKSTCTLILWDRLSEAILKETLVTNQEELKDATADFMRIARLSLQ